MILNVKEYCLLAKISPSTVTYRLNNKIILPGIKEVIKNEETRQYSLVRDESITDENIPKYFKHR